MIIVEILKIHHYPFGRYIQPYHMDETGKCSGEYIRETVLVPLLLSSREDILIDYGIHPYGISFIKGFIADLNIVNGFSFEYLSSRISFTGLSNTINHLSSQMINGNWNTQ